MPDGSAYLVLADVCTLEDVLTAKAATIRQRVHHAELRIRPGTRLYVPRSENWAELRTLNPGDTVYGVLVE